MAQGLPLRLQFERFECKYLLTEAQASAVRRYVAPYVQADPFAAVQPSGRYPIVSLYLDTPDLRLHRETIEGLRNRFKLRIRSYIDDPDAPVFVEIKRRNNQVILKERCPIQRPAIVRLLTTGEARAEGLPPPARKVFDEFVSKLHQIGARPIVRVAYEREAYRGVFDEGARATFDRQIRCRATSRPQVAMNGTGWDLVEGRRVLLELKFSGHCPAWMAGAIRQFDLQRISFSKYSHSVLTAHRAGALLADA